MVKKSPFPPGFLGVDLFYDNAWNTVGDDLKSDGVTVRHGASGEGSAMDVSELGFTVRNGDGKYNPRNPSSPLYGKIGRNTPARATIGLGAPWLRVPPGSGGVAIGDSADFAITGDIDVRVWVDGGPLSVTTVKMLGQWGADNNNAWALTADENGRVVLWWSPDGTTITWRQSSATIPAWAGKIALRASLDVDNGSGGHTARFYYARTLDGPWLPLGEPQTRSGTTSIYNSSDAIRLAASSQITTDWAVYGYEIRNTLAENAWPVSSFRFDRAIPGYRRNVTVSRTNLFHDPFAKGTYALGTSGATAVRADGHFKFTKTAASGVAGYGALRGVMSPFVAPSTTYTVRLEYRIPPGGGVSLYWRPGSSVTSTTGQVLLSGGAPLQQAGEWWRQTFTFTTTATAMGSPAAGLVFQTAAAAPPGFEFEVRNVYIRQGTYADSSAVGTPFDGWTENTVSRGFHYWSGPPYESPSVRYTAVADPGFFSDDQGRYWTIFAPVEVTNRHVIAAGEVAEFPTSWEKTGERSVLTDIAASGPSRRLGQGQRVLNSPMYNSVIGTRGEALAYWPMEDGVLSRNFGPALGNHVAQRAGNVAPAAYDGFKGSKPVPTLGGGSITGSVRQVETSGVIQVRNLLYIPSALSADKVLYELVFRGDTANSVARLEVIVNSAGNFALKAYNPDDALLESTGPVGFEVNGKRVRMSLSLRRVGGSSIDVTLKTLEDGGPGLTYPFPRWTVRGLRSLELIRFNPKQDAAFDGTAVGHVTIEDSISTLYDIPASVMSGYAGETAETRIRRLLLEQGNTPLVFVGAPGVTVDMGPQPTDSWLNVLRDVEKADGGVLHDDIERIGLRYRSLNSLCSQPPVLTLNYEDNKILPFEPVDDDAMTVNAFTASRPDGGEFQYSQESGPLSVLPPPYGVDLYESSDSFNVDTDLWAQRWASWAVHVGTNDEARYPTLGVDLADPRINNDPILLRDLLSLQIGDRIVINNIPPWLPPRPVDVIIMGIRVNATPRSVRLEWTCVPYQPYAVGVFNEASRYSGAGTVTAGSLTATATSFAVTTPVGVAWTHADGDYDILVNGERMTVTNVVGNVFTVTRSVNGVVKTHAAGSAIDLARPAYYSR